MLSGNLSFNLQIRNVFFLLDLLLLMSSAISQEASRLYLIGKRPNLLELQAVLQHTSQNCTVLYAVAPALSTSGLSHSVGFVCSSLLVFCRPIQGSLGRSQRMRPSHCEAPNCLFLTRREADCSFPNSMLRKWCKARKSFCSTFSTLTRLSS